MIAIAVLAQFLDPGFGADNDAAAAFQICFARTGPAQNDAARGEIRGGDVLHQVFRRQIRVLDQRQRCVDDFPEVVGGNVGGHAHRDAAGAVDQHVRETCGQYRGFAVLAVVVVLKIDRVFFDICQQRGGWLVHPHFGVSHGGRIIAVHGSKVALSIEKRKRH